MPIHDDPGHDGYGRYTSAIWLPLPLLETLRQERASGERASNRFFRHRDDGADGGDAEVASPKSESESKSEPKSESETSNKNGKTHEDDAEPTPSEPVASATACPDEVLVFPEAALKEAEHTLRSLEKDVRERCKPVIAQMQVKGGYRTIQSPETDALKPLADRFPNFSSVISWLEERMALLANVAPTDRHIPPLLLNGPPGIGKTQFAEALAKAFTVPFHKFALGASQGCFDLVGTASHWSNATPGHLLQLMARSEVANPVLLLDEIDKAAEDDRFPILPALLDLLDREQSAVFVDQGFRMTFNVSYGLFVATANERVSLGKPLLGRMRVFDIPAPTEDQLTRIIEDQWQALLERLTSPTRPCLDVKTARTLATQGFSPRQTMLLLEQALGRALLDGAELVRQIELPQLATPRTIGFVSTYSAPG